MWPRVHKTILVAPSGVPRGLLKSLFPIDHHYKTHVCKTINRTQTTANKLKYASFISVFIFDPWTFFMCKTSLKLRKAIKKKTLLRIFNGLHNQEAIAEIRLSIFLSVVNRSGKRWNDHNLSDSLAGTQQYPVFNLTTPSVTSEKNGHHVNVVYGRQAQIHMIRRCLNGKDGTHSN